MKPGMELRKAWRAQRKASRQRGIVFLLTFEEWLGVWRKSRKLPQRGRGANGYVMARYGDSGPYALGNIKIITNSQNLREGHWPTMSAKHRRAIWRGYRRKFPKKPKKPRCLCECGCGTLTKPGNKFLHGHAGAIRFRQINADRIGKARMW